jgi:hypothetical protein
LPVIALNTARGFPRTYWNLRYEVNEARPRNSDKIVPEFKYKNDPAHQFKFYINLLLPPIRMLINRDQLVNEQIEELRPSCSQLGVLYVLVQIQCKTALRWHFVDRNGARANKKKNLKEFVGNLTEKKKRAHNWINI